MVFNVSGSRARASFVALAAAVLLTVPAMTRAQSAPKWSLCGPGSFALSAGGQAIGTETFEITCHPDGRYSVTGRTQLAAVAVDLATTIELNRSLLPSSAGAKGTVQGSPFEQTGSYANGTATLVTNGTSQTITYPADASWAGSNIFYPNVFIAARYDEAKGGVQEFTVFPSLKVTVERSGQQGAAAVGQPAATFDRFTMKIAGQTMELWRNAQGRVAGLALPTQGLIAAPAENIALIKALVDGINAPKPSSSTPAAPSSSAQGTAAIGYSAPAGATFTAEEVTVPVPGGNYTLAGTLLVPKGGRGPYPAVVMVTGSGLQTRDSRIQLPGLEQYAPFRQIAERLAANGVAVLRVDDRGVGGSTGRETLAAVTTTSFADDTHAQIAWLRARPEIDGARIIVAGHSEGAAIAAMVGARDPKVFGLVLMAGIAKRGADVAIAQHEDMMRNDTALTDSARVAARAQQKEAVASILAGREVPGYPVNAWTREYMAYDPLPTIRKVKQPVLILQGAHDRQVDASHATMLADALRGSGNSRVTLTVFPTLNHLFLPSKTGSFSEYSHLETSVVPANFLDAFSTWVLALTKPRK
jgi:dipeptidyl aminopeptidase/acylaminoacyl peptidase